MSITAETVEKTYWAMHDKLDHVVPDFELRQKADLVYRINKLKRERNAIILGHNYMEPALFATIPDVVGDSLELARAAAETDKDIIVFCGVHFMAETAKILNPGKTVLLPTNRSGCSLAESITASHVRNLKKYYPGVPVVAYVNCSAEVKAESDICCTSSNAAYIVESLKSDTVIFIPDEFLARNVANETGKRVIIPTWKEICSQSENTARDYQIIGWRGRCMVHERYTPDDIVQVRKQFPGVYVLAHPECSTEVVAASDFSGGTSPMIRQVKKTDAPHYLLLTECSMGDNIIAENPGKDIVRLCSVRCPYMNAITLEETLSALEKNQYVIDVPESVMNRARRSIERMLAA
jgi:quinolinate synthase